MMYAQLGNKIRELLSKGDEALIDRLLDESDVPLYPDSVKTEQKEKTKSKKH